jgi:hypothetical protein
MSRSAIHWDRTLSIFSSAVLAACRRRSREHAATRESAEDLDNFRKIAGSIHANLSGRMLPPRLDCRTGGATMMDEDQAIGVFGMLLIVTVLIIGNALHPSYAKSALPNLHLQDVVSLFNCGDSDTDLCYQAMVQ